ncbi:hypothetical protein [Bacillus sp. UNC438CL73TsuS30]|uniref:hypothetical protein n=1 Tax=Bacillus sp. UNC438CL73TsuS30 TaxID=1340434 RepID=UPI00047DD94A|nr:hypothetical protein [Bacillus sp. UNC438CL73TsuS30]
MSKITYKELAESVPTSFKLVQFGKGQKLHIVPNTINQPYCTRARNKDPETAIKSIYVKDISDYQDDELCQMCKVVLPDIKSIKENTSEYKGEVSLTEKAKKLYLDCDNTDSKKGVLIPLYLENFNKINIYYCMVIGHLINKYATEELEDDWIEYSRESFFIGKHDKEGWTKLKSSVYRLEKKGYVKTKFENGVNYIRLTNEHAEIFNAELYKRKDA